LFNRESAGRNGEEIGSNAAGGLTDNFLEALPPGSYANEILAAWRKKAKQLDDCMHSKSYEHLKGYEYGKSKSNQSSIN
jgi:hypothetical protein